MLMVASVSSNVLSAAGANSTSGVCTTVTTLVCCAHACPQLLLAHTVTLSLPLQNSGGVYVIDTIAAAILATVPFNCNCWPLLPPTLTLPYSAETLTVTKGPIKLRESPKF